ncbi:MAG: phosphocholine cytidylyltransferase family protein [Eubacteriales bacterium]
MKIIILAAGRGSRMGDSTEILPKGMVSIYGKPILQHCLDTLEKAGINREDIAIVTGYHKEKIDFSGVTYFHNENWANTNMFMSLMETKSWLQQEPCIMCYSDILFSAEPILKLIKSTADFAMTSYTGFWELWEKRFPNPLEDLETFIIKEGKLTEIGQKPSDKSQIMGQYMGLLRISPNGWDIIEKAVKLPMPKPVEKLDMTTLLQHLLTLKNEIEVINCDDLWLECDNEEDVRVYEANYQF